MAYPSFDPLRPDPTSDNGSDAFTVTRTNLLALRDAVLAGTLVGWDLAVSGGTAARPTNWTYSKGTERVRLTITWGTSGGPSGKPKSLVVEYSSDSGGAWESLGTCTITYDSNGNFTGASGLAPGLAAHWLMGLPGRIAAAENTQSSHASSSNPHSGSASTTDLNNHAAKGDGVHGVPAGKSVWHSGNLTFAYDSNTETLDITTS